VQRNGFFSCLAQELRNDGAFLLRAAIVALCVGGLIALVLTPAVLLVKVLG